MEIIYRADDGAIFDNEDDCEHYETGFLFKDIKNSGEYHMFDADGDDCIDVESCYYLKVDTERALKYIKWLSDSVGVSVPENFSVGATYYYEDYFEEWHSVDAEMEKLKNIKELFK